jgi:hypothetical protein
MEGGPGSRTGGQDQAEIPAWLETLRVGERPAAPVSNSTNFSTADLIEDGSLPSWMRSGRSQASSSSVSDAFNALHPVSGASPLTDQHADSQKGLAAQSLIDEQSLPSWMRKDGSSPAMPSTGFEASSLVDAAALPDWMRSLQPQESSPVVQQPAPSAPDAAPDWMRSLQPSQSSPSAMSDAGPVAPAAKGFSARDLLDEKSLPSWMAQPDGAAALPNNGQPVQPGSLSPSSLIDQNALPAWMTQQDGAAANPNNGKAAPANNNGQAIQLGSLSPSSLIDQNALPAWMQENGNSSSQVPSLPPQSSPSWQAPRPAAQPPLQGPSAQNAAGPNENLAASSFIDNNALPDWLRSESGQPSQPPANMTGMPPQPEPSRSGAYSGPPRVENMRVPSRPRGEVNANDGSEAAANVFASVLGVASASPQLPPSSPTQAPYGQQGPGQYPPVQNSPQNPPMGMPGQMPAYNNATGMNQQNQPGFASGSYGMGQINNVANRASLGVPSPGVMPPQPPYNNNNPASAAQPNAAVQANDQKSSNKKRGIVDTLLGWLLH